MSFKGQDYGELAANQENRRQAAVNQGIGQVNSSFSGFTPSFYQQRAKDYVNWATPQLSSQYITNRNAIGANLANRGLMNSSAAKNQWSSLARSTTQAKQTVADAGQSASNALQQQVEAQRANILDQLYQSADPAGAASAAGHTAASYAAPSVFPAVGNLFSGIANQYYLSSLINSYRPTSFIQSAPSYSASSAALPPVTQ